MSSEQMESATNRISGGASRGMPACPSCPYLKHDKRYPGWGWCDHAENRVRSKGWPEGFTPSQSPTGSCELHPDRAAALAKGEGKV